MYISRKKSILNLTLIILRWPNRTGWTKFNYLAQPRYSELIVNDDDVHRLLMTGRPLNRPPVNRVDTTRTQQHRWRTRPNDERIRRLPCFSVFQMSKRYRKWRVKINPPVFINNTRIPTETETKYLGQIVDLMSYSGGPPRPFARKENNTQPTTKTPFGPY